MGSNAAALKHFWIEDISLADIFNEEEQIWMVHKRFNPQLSVSTQIPVVSIAASQKKKKSRFCLVHVGRIKLSGIQTRVIGRRSQYWKCVDSYCFNKEDMKIHEQQLPSPLRTVCPSWGDADLDRCCLMYMRWFFYQLKVINIFVWINELINF